ncbi:MAG: glycosyltransferase family 4 protein [Euryarchaeota archaeon]|nr:glycosyltransferase family 4 protein [Euryarchaeota archaeon]
MSSPLRIGHFSWESSHAVKVGGISPHVTALSELQAEQGHEVHLFTRQGDKAVYEQIRGVHHQRVPHDFSGNIVDQMDRMCGAMVDRFYAVEELFGAFDLLHIHDWHAVEAQAVLHTTRPRVPWVMTFHSTEWGRGGNAHPVSWEGREIAHREWLGGYLSRAVVATSVPLRSEMKMLYQIPDEKIHLVPNGVFSVAREVDAGKVKEKYGIHPLAPVVLFVGRMTYQKGPDLLVEAIPRVLGERWDAKFVFAGEGDLRGPCQARAQELGVGGACRFLGYVSDETVVEWLNACDLLCVPSRNEPFGIVALEAWSAGKPVVGTEAVDIIHNFVDGVRAYIQPGSIAWCLGHVLGDMERARWMGKQGREKVEREYRWEKILAQTESLYRRVLNSA